MRLSFESLFYPYDFDFDDRLFFCAHSISYIYIYILVDPSGENSFVVLFHLVIFK